MPPDKLGRYEILSELGQGAMGVVYLARDPLIGRQLALKTFRLGYSAGDQELEQFRTRFLREAQSAGILSHPNIVTIHDVAIDPGGDFFIAMEYVQGTDLKLLMQRQRLAVNAAVELVAQIADGLGYAHSKGVVHRDVKPANIIITADKQAKITDFGIARVETSNLTMEGQLLGTPNYMAPEQIQGQEVDYRADIFSLGVMLYEMVTGKKPFAAENLTAVTHKIVFEPFPPLEETVPGLPAGITQVLNRALAKDPAQRYDGGAEMAADLRAIFTPAGTAAVPVSETSRSGSFLSPDAPDAALVPDASVPQPAVLAPDAVDSTVVAPAAATVPVATVPAATVPAATPTGNESMPLAAVATVTEALPPVVVPPIPDAHDAAAGPRPADGRDSFLAIPSVARVALALGATLVVALIAIGVGRLLLKGEEAAVRESPEVQRQLEILPHVKQGQQLLATGEPAAALSAFERALAIAPDDRDVRRWHDQAQRQLEQLAGADGEEGQAKARPDPAPPSRPSPPPPPPAAVPVAQATLVVDFHSAASEGRITIFDGQEKLYQKRFKFVSGKSGVLRRARGTSGSLQEMVTLTSGDLDLRIYVKLKDRQTKSAEVQGNLPPNGTRTLRIRVSNEGRINAELE